MTKTQVHYKVFAPGQVLEIFETFGKLINFMDGLKRWECLNSARCKAMECYRYLNMLVKDDLKHSHPSMFDLLTGNDEALTDHN